MGEGGDSGLIIDVESPDPRARFKVYVNNAPVATVAPGRRIALFLPAYKNYSVRLGPSGGDPTDFDAQERKVSLYPGNMVRLSWTATRLIEVFGRAIDQNGDPVSQAVAIGADQEAVTDGAGYFQTAISAQQELIFQRLDGSACRVDLAGTHSVNGYAALGSRRCIRLEAQKPTAKPTSGTGATLAEAFR
jgi:hypothetical protein